MTTDADNAAIAALTQKVVAAWAYADAESFASVFTDDGTMILPGVFCASRDEVRTYMAEAFAGRYKGTQVIGKPISIRAVGPDVAILLSKGGILQPGETEMSEAGAIRASWLVVRREGQWRLFAYQNSPLNDPNAVDAAA
ncbi:SgcJ/EcaC family oxidoreductase [Saccharothrix longispora]|uniref:SgcJ/EcaC family oxidoreductase n=1 Tax=Saccharothrix longispora TaxID=33920 RepID=UPI0028FD21A7|nr:SgcJ/EcaC family oxidoreductase [Saccharothrix longispora]MBY8852232.1 SgcJ/EcaC family oxidoreductase [Saccharothrix sp. MB29]MDU0293489.1 SgcJ/EcaC family oxidoreductase [Saccharothrix longispora]